MHRKNSTTLLLMTSSIVLLLMLQAFWLTNSYEKANFDLRRETNMLFRNVVFIMRDSTISKNIQSFSVDSTTKGNTDAIAGIVSGFAAKDRNDKPGEHLQVYISSDGLSGDSLPRRNLRPIITRIQEEHRHGKNRFFIRLDSDSLSTDSLTRHFRKALDGQGINASFRVTHAPVPPPPHDRGRHRRNFFRDFGGDSLRDQPIHPFDKAFETESVHYNPVHRYSAVLTDFRAGLVRQIMPQILFSIFLTAVTILSFILLYRSIRSQQRLMELKNDFVSNMTHELKTPIATVSVALEALKDFKAIEDPKRTQEYLSMAQHELNRLSILTDNVLNSSLFEENRINFAQESVDLNDIIEQVLASLKLVFEKSKAQVTFLHDGNNFTVNGSTIHLTNLIYNLLDNAIKYSEQYPVIEIKISDMGDSIKLHVKDQGIGIATEYKEKVFEKFFRVPTGNVHTVKGYGLGLSYVNNFVIQHGGKISVESNLGKGSEFIISIPHKPQK